MSKRIITVCGSLRTKSLNRKLMDVIDTELKKLDVQVSEAKIDKIPLYNGDIEVKGIPKVVEDFKDKLKNSDGVVIVGPEYNASISGVLKNAIDWASRPTSEIDEVFGMKPVMLAGASTGARATTKAQAHVALILKKLGMIVSPKEMLLGGAPTAFDEKGNLANERDQMQVEKVSKYFLELVRKISS